jgi:hypothetical protein
LRGSPRLGRSVVAIKDRESGNRKISSKCRSVENGREGGRLQNYDRKIEREQT